MSTDEEVTKLFRIQKTVMQMLKDRGYLVEDYEINETKAQFVSKFGENVKRSDLSIKKANRDDASDQIYVFFPDNQVVKVPLVKRSVKQLTTENVFKAILVVQQPIAKKAINEISTDTKFSFEVFQEEELLVNINEYDLFPEHQVLTTEEKKALLERYTLKETQLPRIEIMDPIARYYGLKRGQVVKIIRPSETAGKYVTYRYVV